MALVRATFDLIPVFTFKTIPIRANATLEQAVQGH